MISVMKSAGVLTTTQAAAVLGVSRPTVIRWCDAGVLTSERVTEHRDRRIPAAEVMRVHQVWRPGKAR